MYSHTCMHPVLLNLVRKQSGTHPQCWIDIITAVFYCNIYISCWCVNVAMLIRYMPCGQLDLDDSFLQHIFNWRFCEVQQHYLSGLSFKYVQYNYRVDNNTFSYSLAFLLLLVSFTFICCDFNCTFCDWFCFVFQIVSLLYTLKCADGKNTLIFRWFRLVTQGDYSFLKYFL